MSDNKKDDYGYFGTGIDLSLIHIYSRPPEPQSGAFYGAYGAVIGLLYAKLNKRGVAGVYMALVPAMRCV